MILRRILGIVIALAVPLAVVGGAAIATYRPGPPENAKLALDRYLTHLRKAGRPATTVAASLATYPRRFTADLSGLSYGNASYFYVQDDNPRLVTPGGPLTGKVVTYAVAVTYSVPVTPVEVFGGQRPLPYPPSDIWCVELQPETTGGEPATVLLALHGDLYVDTWVVHELPPDTAASTVDLVGCGPQ